MLYLFFIQLYRPIQLLKNQNFLFIYKKLDKNALVRYYDNKIKRNGMKEGLNELESSITLWDTR